PADADQNPSPRRRADGYARDQGGDPRRRGDADPQQVPDSRDVLQPDLLREPGLWPEGGGGHVLRRDGPEPADARTDGPSRWSSAGPFRLRPHPEHGGREGASRARARRDGRQRVRDGG